MAVGVFLQLLIRDPCTDFGFHQLTIKHDDIPVVSLQQLATMQTAIVPAVFNLVHKLNNCSDDDQIISSTNSTCYHKPHASYYLKRQVQKFSSFFHLISFSFYIYEMEHNFSTVLMAFSTSLVSDFSSKYYLAFDTYKITHARYFMMALINNTNVANFHMAFQRVNFAFIPVLLIKQKLCKKQLSYTTVANGQISSLYSKSISIMCITSIIVHFNNKFAGFFNISSSSSISTRSAVLCNNRY